MMDIKVELVEPPSSKIKVLHIDGTYTEEETMYIDEKYYAWSLHKNDWHFEPFQLGLIDNHFVTLYDLITGELYNKNGLDYYEGIESQPMWRVYAGTDSESMMSKVDFENMVKDGDSSLFRELYLVDCHNQVRFVQDKVFKINSLLIHFYKELCCLHIDERTKERFDNSGFYTTSDTVSSLLMNVFISIYSALDQFTKLCYLVENLQNDFSKYPKLKNEKIQFGDKNKLQIEKSDTVFEDCDTISYISTLRNAFVHDATLQAFDKIYIGLKDGEVYEKIIFLPDMEPKYFDRHINRCRFFSRGTRLNLILPELIDDFFKRVDTTIIRINEILEPEYLNLPTLGELVMKERCEGCEKKN